LDLAVNTLVRIDPPLRNGHRTRVATFRITTPGEDPAEFLVAGPTQKVTRIGAEAADLTVSALEPPDGFKIVKTDAEYLANTRFLQTRDPEVMEHARKAAAGQTNPVQVAFNMERYVHEKLAKKNFSTALASAAEVAKSLEGDCTEHAVLLAAMLRAGRIPSRIAVGLVYIESRSSFGGHMWTEAYLGGQWFPLDATLGRGGIAAGHIKLSESSFADAAAAPVTAFLPLLKILGKMKIEVVQAQ
jgi:transglutaminase-like putative cysteine protease